MTKRHFTFGVLVLVTIVVLAVIIAVVKVKSQDRDAQISAQRDIERNEIIQAEKTKRTQERLKAIPWYKDGEETP